MCADMVRQALVSRHLALAGGLGKLVESVGAVLLAFVVGAILLIAIGKDPTEAYGALIDGAVGGAGALAYSLVVATPLILASLAVALSFRSGFFNIGAGGQVGVGAIAAAVVGGYLHLSGPLVMALMLVLGGLAGAFWGGMAGLLRAYTGASEVITTLMLNYVATLLIDYLVTGPLRAPGPAVQSATIPPDARFPILLPDTQLNATLLLALAAVPAVWLLLWRTTYGFELRMVGLNPEAARAAGMSVRRVASLSLAASGFLAGLAGAVQVGGILGSLPQDFSIQVGFDAIAAALLGANNPWGVLVASLFLGGLNGGSATMEATVGVSGPFVQFLEAVVIATVVAAPFALGAIRPRLAGWVRVGGEVR
ncbi:MAG TPA: ABC transporter permease [Candidatus Dormibacteraeota bacterium]|nr:ABC transporter permease [Candidatus Dormibacteraeota bacterium]